MRHSLIVRAFLALACVQFLASATGAQAPPAAPSPPPAGAAGTAPAAPGGAAPASQSGAPATPGQAPAGAAPTTRPPTPESIERAARVLAETRTAMGGDKLAAVTSVLATGRTRRVRGNNLVPIEFEIALELPNKYVRKDEVPAEESDPTSSGFVGDELIQLPAAPSGPPGGGRAGAPAPTPEQVQTQRRNRVATVKQDYVRFALGLFANSPAAYPVTFSYAAQAAAPQGTADVLDVKGEGTFALRLFIHSETKLPIMVSWQAPPTNVILSAPGQPAPQNVAPGAVIVPAPAAPAANASQDAKDSYAKEVAEIRRKAQSTPVEYRIYYADYRDVEGLKWPFRLRRAIGPDTTEETTVDRYRINTRIDPRKFALAK